MQELDENTQRDMIVKATVDQQLENIKAMQVRAAVQRLLLQMSAKHVRPFQTRALQLRVILARARGTETKRKQRKRHELIRKSSKGSTPRYHLKHLQHRDACAGRH